MFVAKNTFIFFALAGIVLGACFLFTIRDGHHHNGTLRAGHFFCGDIPASRIV